MAQMQLSDREIAPDSEPGPRDDDRETLHVDFHINHTLYSGYRTIKRNSSIIFLEKLLTTDDEVIKCLENSYSWQEDDRLRRGSVASASLDNVRVTELLKRSPLSLLVKRQKHDSRARAHFETPLMPFRPELFNQVINALDLPASYQTARWSDSGTANITPKGIVIQTPFYATGFWSLALCRRTKRMTTGAFGFLEIDNGVNLDHVLLNVYRAKKDLGFTHPFLLPLCLFEAHIRGSANAFMGLFREIEDIELKIRQSLGDKEFEGKAQALLYASLSKRLHICGSQHGDLFRRRAFEKRVAAALKSEMDQNIMDGLADDSAPLQSLNLRIHQAIDMAASHDSMLEALPDRIRSQTTLIKRLILQRDSESMVRIADDSRRIAEDSKADSYAMKTIAVLTTLFLPGTFVASLFSTSMFDFQASDPDAHIAVSRHLWVYWVVTIALTFVVVGLWQLWLKERRSYYTKAIRVKAKV